MPLLDGRVAVITGAAGGIGLALARRFAAEGAALVVSDLDDAALQRAAAGLRDAGAQVLAVRADVARPDDVEALAAAAYAAHGAVHVVVNNAGVAAAGAVWEHTLDDWRWLLGVNLWGVIHGVRAFVPRMLAGGQPGWVVNVASMAGLTANPMMGAYNVTKHGVVALTETLHHDLRLRGAALRAVLVCPGWVRTDIATSARARPAELAEAGPRARFADAIAQLVAAGLPPEAVADAVVDALAQGRFWVLTHPHFLGAVRHRADELLAGRDPTIAPLPGA